MLDAASQQAASYIVETTTTAAVNENHRKRLTTTTPTPPDEPPTSTNFSSAPGFTINLSDTCLPDSTIKGSTFIPTYNRQPCNQIYDLHPQYVGETSRCLADRLNDHRSYIRTNKTTPTGAHIRLPHHSSNDVIITGIEQLQSTATATYRRIREQAWIALLQTWHPHGINHPSTYRGSKSTTVPQH
jgi:hypothetical protein